MGTLASLTIFIGERPAEFRADRLEKIGAWCLNIANSHLSGVKVVTITKDFEFNPTNPRKLTSFFQRVIDILHFLVSFPVYLIGRICLHYSSSHRELAWWNQTPGQWKELAAAFAFVGLSFPETGTRAQKRFDKIFSTFLEAQSKVPTEALLKIFGSFLSHFSSDKILKAADNFLGPNKDFILKAAVVGYAQKSDHASLCALFFAVEKNAKYMIPRDRQINQQQYQINCNFRSYLIAMVSALSPSQFASFFNKESGVWKLNKDIMKLVLYARINDPHWMKEMLSQGGSDILYYETLLSLCPSTALSVMRSLEFSWLIEDSEYKWLLNSYWPGGGNPSEIYKFLKENNLFLKVLDALSFETIRKERIYAFLNPEEIGYLVKKMLNLDRVDRQVVYNCLAQVLERGLKREGDDFPHFTFFSPDRCRNRHAFTQLKAILFELGTHGSIEDVVSGYKQIANSYLTLHVSSILKQTVMEDSQRKEVQKYLILSIEGVKKLFFQTVPLDRQSDILNALKSAFTPERCKEDLFAAALTIDCHFWKIEDAPVQDTLSHYLPSILSSIVVGEYLGSSRRLLLMEVFKDIFATEEMQNVESISNLIEEYNSYSDIKEAVLPLMEEESPIVALARQPLPLEQNFPQLPGYVEGLKTMHRLFNEALCLRNNLTIDCSMSEFAARLNQKSFRKKITLSLESYPFNSGLLYQKWYHQFKTIFEEVIRYLDKNAIDPALKFDKDSGVEKKRECVAYFTGQVRQLVLETANTLDKQAAALEIFSKRMYMEQIPWKIDPWKGGLLQTAIGIESQFWMPDARLIQLARRVLDRLPPELSDRILSYIIDYEGLINKNKMINRTLEVYCVENNLPKSPNNTPLFLKIIDAGEFGPYYIVNIAGRLFGSYVDTAFKLLKKELGRPPLLVT